jgi:hypothetical protein
VPGLGPALMPGSYPLAHCRIRNPENTRDRTLLPPLCLQLKRPPSASFFPVFRKRMRVHACNVARRQNLEAISKFNERTVNWEHEPT